MKSVITKQAFKEDRTLSKLLWNKKWDKPNEELKKKMRIGYVASDEYYPASSPIRRAVYEAVEALRQRGHECVEVELPNLKRATLNYFAVMSAEGKMRSFFAALQGEPMIKEYEMIKVMTFMPGFLRRFIKRLLMMAGQRRSAEMLDATNEKMAFELLGCNKEMLLCRDQTIDFFEKNKFDGLISPGLALPAVRHGTSRELMLSCCYTLYWNLVNFPTGVLPITQVKTGEEVYEGRQFENDMYHKKSVECMRESAGLPVGVQVSTLPNKDEKCLFIMKEIESVVDFHKYAL